MVMTKALETRLNAKRTILWGLLMENVAALREETETVCAGIATELD